MNDANEKIVIRAEDLLPPATLDVTRACRRATIAGAVASKTFLWGAAFCVLAVVIVGTLWGHKFWDQPTWLERVAAAADNSVVQIRITQSLGTGFVVASSRGRHLVLTNRHVVTEDQGVLFFTSPVLVDECKVILRSGEERTGRLVAVPKDPGVDLAMVLVESPNLRTLGRVRPFQEVRQGECVAAVGHPLGIEFNLTAGIVSAKKEGLWIVTDAQINHGNSGGPLIDESLAVVGVNTVILGVGMGGAVRADFVWRKGEWDYASDISDLLDRLR